MKTDNLLICDVHIYDYEHSGDSRAAYNILSSFGITSTMFQNNGDGNVAFLSFAMPYNKNKLKRLNDALNNAGYGLSCSNLWEFEGKNYKPLVLQVLPITDTMLSAAYFNEIPSYKTIVENKLDDWKVGVTATMYVAEIERNPQSFSNAVMMLKALGCENVKYERNGMEVWLRGFCYLSKIKRNRDSILGMKARFRFVFSNDTINWRNNLTDAVGLGYIQYYAKNFSISPYRWIYNKIFN